jgi:hypothetical protein
MTRKAKNMPVEGGSPYERLEELLLGGEGERIRSLDDDMRRAEPVRTITVLTSDSSNVRRIGSFITNTDRELRRAVVIIGPQGRPYDFGGDTGVPPRPVHPVDGGLLVRDASPGSLELVVDAYGDVLALLISQPMSALVTVATLGQGFASLRAWLRRRRDDLGEEQLPVLREARGGVGRVLHETPDQQLEIYPTGEDEGPFVSILDAGEFYVRGRQITHIRIYPDGTQDIIYVQSELNG